MNRRPSLARLGDGIEAVADGIEAVADGIEADIAGGFTLIAAAEGSRARRGRVSRGARREQQRARDCVLAAPGARRLIHPCCSRTEV